VSPTYFLLVLAPTPNLSLTPSERFALDLLVDLSAVLQYPDSKDVVRVEVAGASDLRTLAQLRARNWGIAVGDGVVTLDRGLLAFVIDVALAAVEQRSSAADRFNRVPGTETPLVGAQAEREPVISVAARALASAVRAAAGRRRFHSIDPWPQGRQWAVALSHDLDVVQWWPAFTSLRLLELLRRGELSRALRVVGSAAMTGGRDVVWRGIRGVLDAEAEHQVRSTWFVLCGSPTLATARAGDLTYSPESNLTRRILDAIAKAGHEIGLHGSFATSGDHALFPAQRDRLQSLAGRVVGVRQHYLRMRPDSTPRGMAKGGFQYDSTFGYADRNGFRLGTADVVPLWNVDANAPVGIDEAPFAWMDRALSKYRRVEDPDAWIDDALALADACRNVNGLWVGIWHPNLTPALGFPDAPKAYRRLVASLSQREPWFAPLGEIVAWRRARRSARVTGVRSDGSIIVTADAPMVIRDAAGRAIDG
jgi:peptidoglycan/xylan/chitin deacetylase (PgdA/CDA1 family)